MSGFPGYTLLQMEAILTYRSNNWGKIFKRLLIAFITFLLASMMIFFTIHVFVPSGGDIFSPLNPEGVIVACRFQVDKPVMEQYFQWIGGVFRGDFGTTPIDYSTDPK